jgi:hypothetical protein
MTTDGALGLLAPSGRSVGRNGRALPHASCSVSTPRSCTSRASRRRPPRGCATWCRGRPAARRGPVGRGALPTCPCPTVGSLPMVGHVAAPPDPSCHSTRTPRPWSAPWWAAATRSRRAPRGPPRTTCHQSPDNVSPILTGCPRESPRQPAARTSACPHAPGHASGGAPGLWGVSRAQSAGTALIVLPTLAAWLVGRCVPRQHRGPGCWDKAACWQRLLAQQGDQQGAPALPTEVVSWDHRSGVDKGYRVV